MNVEIAINLTGSLSSVSGGREMAVVNELRKVTCPVRDIGSVP